MRHVNGLHHSAPAAGPSAGFDVLAVASTIILALSLVTPMIHVQVGATAGLVLLGQGLYSVFRRPHRR